MKARYNEIPVTLHATMESFSQLHTSSIPLGMDVVLATRESTLSFKGTATDPLHVDGLDGTLALETRRLGDVLAIFQLHSAAGLPMQFSSKLLRTGDLWRLLNVIGVLSAERFNGALELTEGKPIAPKRVQPDRLSVELAFDTLDANELMRAGLAGDKPGVSMPTVDPDPAVVGEMRASAKRIVYGKTEITDAATRAVLMPSEIRIADARFTVAGARADLVVTMEPATPGTLLSGVAKLENADLAQLTRIFGIGRPPLDGRLSTQATLTMSGATMVDALKHSHETVVLSMLGGAVSRQLVEHAAIDLGALFGDAAGSARVTCLLAIADLHGLAGRLAPIRLISSEGTIEGFGQVDFLRKSTPRQCLTCCVFWC